MKGSEMTPFCFHSGEVVRVIQMGDEPWFVARDVCDVLELGNPTKAVGVLDDDELTLLKVTSGGQGREMNIISESGLYTLIFRSNKPQAKPFRRWVTHDVLPTIRKTGSYCLLDDGGEAVPVDDGPSAISVPRLEEASKGIKAAMIMARAFGYKNTQARQYANTVVKKLTGVDSLALLNVPVDNGESGRRGLPDPREEMERAVLRFVEECCVEEADTRISSTWLYERFRRWFEGQIDSDVPSHRGFGVVLGKYFRRSKTKGLTYYKNIRLREEA